MSTNCTPVFDIATAGYTAWPLVAIGSMVTLIILVLFIIVSRLRRLPATIWIAPVLAGILTIGFFISTWTDYRNALIARTTGQCDAIEGTIENFVAEPLGGHSDESFTVDGRLLHYGTFVLTPGFHLSRARGGPFGPGVYVRLLVRGNDILYAEVCGK